MVGVRVLEAHVLKLNGQRLAAQFLFLRFQNVFFQRKEFHQIFHKVEIVSDVHKAV